MPVLCDAKTMTAVGTDLPIGITHNTGMRVMTGESDEEVCGSLDKDLKWGSFGPGCGEDFCDLQSTNSMNFKRFCPNQS